MRRNLHHRLSRAAAYSLSEELQQITGFRRSMRRRTHFVHNMIFNRADENCLATDMIQHRVEQERGGRFAVGPRHAAERQVVFGMTKEVGGESRQRLSSMLDFDQCDLREISCSGIEGRRGVRNDGDRSLPDRGDDIAIAVSRAALHGEKERACRDAARVVLDATDGDVNPAAAEVRTPQLLEGNQRRPWISSQAMAARAVRTESASEANDNRRPRRNHRPRRWSLFPREAVPDNTDREARSSSLLDYVAQWLAEKRRDRDALARIHDHRAITGGGCVLGVDRWRRSGSSSSVCARRCTGRRAGLPGLHRNT